MTSRSTPETDEWLSSVMQRKCFRVSAATDDLDKLRAPGTFAYAKVEPSSIKEALLLQDFGFYLVDTNVQLAAEKVLIKTPGPSARLASRHEPTSIQDEVCRIAESSFAFTRFHLDPKIETPLANRIKREWVANFFRGERGDQLVIAEDAAERPIGFLLALKAGERTVIDLIATDPSAQGKGAGKAMVTALAKANPGGLLVGTQLANLPSLGFYQSMGFQISNAKYVFHYHSKAAS